MSDPRGYDDELISAYLDGEASPDEADRIERDPQAQARVAELAAVQAAVADPVAPLAAAERDRLRAAAAAVRPISAARPRRPRAFIPVAAAAGIAAVVLGAMAVLRSVDDGSEDSTAASAPATAVQPTSDDSADTAAESAAASDMAITSDMAMAEESETAADAEDGDSAFGADMAEEAEMAAEPESPAAATTMADMDAAPEAEALDETLDPADDGADPEPTDLGSFVGLEQLIDRLALILADDDDFTGPFTEPGLCARPVAERVAELSAEVVGEARAELEDSAESEPGGAVDLAVAATGDGDLLLVYAVEPNCEIEVAALE